MTTFELEVPTSLRSAVDLLDPHDPSVRVIAGGTALMLMMKAGVFRPSRLISLRAIEQEFSTFSSKPDGSFRIGAMATLSATGTRAGADQIRPGAAADIAHSLERARAQRGDDRRAPRACRSAHGSARRY